MNQEGLIAELEALKGSSERFREIVENAPIGFFQSTPEGRFSVVNPALARMLGYETPEAAVEGIASIGEQLYVEPELRGEVVEAVMAGPDWREFVVTYRRRNDDRFTARLRIRSVWDKEGRFRHLEGFVEDETERLLTEERLKVSEERFRRMADGTADGIVIVNPEGDIRFVNSAAQGLFGLSEKELVGREFGTPMFAGESSELSVYSKDGTLRIVEIRCSEIECDGEECLLAALRDVTDRKKAEEERERLIAQLREALAEVKTLRGFIPICANCKKIRDDAGYWQQVEKYVETHTEAQFSHSICPACSRALYPELQDEGD